MELGKTIDIKNIDGKTPKDLAMFIKNSGERQKLMLILNREFT